MCDQCYVPTSQNFVFWPKTDDIVKMMPHCFKESFADNTTIIIDYFEIKSGTPSNLLTASQSWSNNKHSQTIKYLIVITLQGSVCFIGEAWGGRVCDTVLKKNSTLFKNLVSGDVIIADRGFLLKDACISEK
nr:unnamed protein product [Callosobruchus analis]